MAYIVFDLEWNQSPDGKNGSNRKLPFEIIEIGAVKLNEEMEIVDRFQCLIRPKVYKWIHNSIREVIHMNYRELKNGVPFPQAMERFLNWCGPAPVFFTWGSQDLTELQRNMKYYDMLGLLKGPILYYNVQKLFGIAYETRKSCRSLEYAIDYLKIEKWMDFHRALADAYYTAEVLRKMDAKDIFPNSSIDIYQNPKSKKEEVHICYPTYDKYVSREFSARENVMRDREVSSTRCPVCKKPAKRKIRWFLCGSKNYYSVSICEEHGLVKGKSRVRKAESGNYYAVKTIKLISKEEAEEIRDKRDSLRQKRQLKKRNSGKIVS
ncbi:MAG: exonuclease domain-containing protein [Blautia sp.]|nr:exonuclease domain-containing protein [Blautia sp.]